MSPFASGSTEMTPPSFMLAGSCGQPGAIFRHREIERAARLAAQLPLREVVDRAPLRHARRALLAASLFALATVALFPRAWRFELPRFLAFWTDALPFTLTDFTVTPRGVRLFSGDGLTITVRVGGLRPHRLELITEQAGEPGDFVGRHRDEHDGGKPS